MKKRLSLLMVVMMLVSMLPMSAFAADSRIKMYVDEIAVEKDSNANQSSQKITAKIEIGRGATLRAGRLIFTLTNGAKFVVQGGEKEGAGSTLTSSNAVAYSSTDLSSSTYVDIADDIVGKSELSMTFNVDITDAEDVVSLQVEQNPKAVGGVSYQDMGISNIPAAGFKAVNITTAGRGLEVKVLETEARTSFYGGELSPFEIRKHNDKEIVIKLDYDEYYAFDSTETKVIVDGIEISNMGLFTNNGYVLTIPAQAAKVVRVEPFLKSMGARATEGDVDVEIKADGQTVYTTIGRVTELDVVVTVVEKDKKEIPSLWGGEESTVTVTLKGPKGSFSNHAIEFEVKDASVLKGSLRGLKTKPSQNSLGFSATNADRDNTIYKDGKFVLYTNDTDLSEKTEITFDMTIRTDYDFEGEVTLNAYQRGWEATVDAAKVTPKFTVETKATEVKKGSAAVEVAPIVIKEAKAGLLKKGERITLVLDDKYGYILFAGKEGIEIEATNGMVLSDIKVADTLSSKNVFTTEDSLKDGDRPIVTDFKETKTGVAVIATVKKPSKGEAAEITIKGQKVIVDGSRPDATVLVKAGIEGYTVQEADYVAIVKEYSTESVETVFTIGQTTYTVNGVEKTSHAAPYIKNSKTMLPVRVLAESLGLDVQWNQATQTASFTDANKVAAVKIGANVIYVNGTPFDLAVPAELTNDTTFIELRSLATAFGIQIDWDNAAKTAIVSR